MEESSSSCRRNNRDGSAFCRPPQKRPRWDASIPTLATSKPCSLQPYIEELIQTDPEDIAQNTSILQKVHACLVDQEQGKMQCSSSLASLHQILVVRLGYLAGSKHGESDSSTNDFQFLVLSCWKRCHGHFEAEADTSVPALDSVVAMLLRITEEDLLREQGKPTMTQERERIILCAIDLLQVWFGDPSTLHHFWNNQDLMEEMMFVLKQIAAATANATMALEIKSFLQTLKSRVPNLPFLSEVSENGEGRGTDEAVQSVISILQDSNSTSLTRKAAIRTMKSFLNRLLPDQLCNCIEVLSSLREEPAIRTPVMIVALGYLKKRIVESTGSNQTWNHLFQILYVLALEDTSNSYSIREAACFPLIALSEGVVSLVTSSAQRRTFIQTVGEILHSSFGLRVTLEAASLVCRWINDDDDGLSCRKVLLETCPQVLNPLAQVIISRRVPSTELLRIIQAFGTILKEEPANNFLARQPRVLDACIAMAIFESIEDSTSTTLDSSWSLSQQIQWTAMQNIISLSKNPCNRRIMAKHPGLLSGMMHFSRQLSRRPLQDSDDDSVAKDLREDTNRQILLLAYAL